MASTYSELTYLEYTGAVDNSGNGVKARFDFQGVDRGAQFIANTTWSVSMSNTDGPMCFIATNNQEVSGVTAKILTSAYESQVASGTLEMYPLTAGTTYRLQAYTEGGTPEVDLTFTPELNNNPRAKDLASGTLAESISASTTNLLVYVGDGSASTIKAVWPDTPFYATLMPASPSAGVPNNLDSEIVKVTAVGNDQVGNTALTVVRGQKGSTTQAFAEGAIVTNADYADDAVRLGESGANTTRQLIDKDGNVIYPDVGLDLDSVVYSDDPGETVDDIIDPNSYSTEEKWTGGYWVDGRKIYKKTINFGSLPNNTTKNVAHGITSLDKIIKWEGASTNTTNNQAILLPSPANALFTIVVNNTNIVIMTTSDRRNYSYSYITLYYTKTS